MSKNYTVQTKILKPVTEVFQAIVTSETIIRYFCDAVSSDLLEGAEVIWTWNDYGSNSVLVKTVRENELIELVLDSKNWDKTTNDRYEVTVSMEFEALDDRSTMLSISESGWRTDAEGLKGSHDNCGGWAQMTICLKAFLEYGIDLR
ncbi:MAG: SRPBCC domain-containing protein [Gammaproteobacteria bacterium]|jgi:uncharacterized protein YndB with AHSA1/START domain|nr:SRPBCC domain-containing protein [Gammaproteobacteria bacterium]MDP6535053.1 SRPBCC domain-containing protein [Gammaproteobacteria bacterium]MDP6733252.1 SRPBCC domain-containing protein [Gammaproteobacteria bacterium]|tara:strand:- start:1173 stop:1613 length:441 start_codon:yes stop_codon:yes gene_type:complete